MKRKTHQQIGYKMVTIEDYYQELGKFGHLGQTYSLNIIKELKDAKERIVGLEQDCSKSVEMRMDTLKENAKLLIGSKLVEQKISNRIQELYSSIELLDYNNDEYDYGRIDGAIEELKQLI